MAVQEYKTLREFWPFYLAEHKNAFNRTLHFIGSTGVLVLLGLAIYFRDWRYLVAMPLCGYGFAWVGHFFVEKNRPATFKYPIKSFVSDWIMYFYIWTGQIGRELDKIKA
ncbi:MAG: DUF962 domain-containing protein [Spirochaetia bacterium]|nr:DUF962 domain-containing protein [Spirochaetia bacterium]